jgi:type I restriction enzyme, S subunit
LPDAVSRTATDVAIKGATLNKASLAAIPLRHPALPIQQRIATIVTNVDNAIESTEALIEKHQQIKAGLMHDLFTRGVLPDGSLRPSRQDAPDQYQLTKAGWIPVDWSLTTCEAVCERVIDCKNRTPPETHDGFPVIRTPNVRHGEFVDDELVFTDARSFATWTSRGKPMVGDVVITREAPVGEVCMIPERHPNACLGQRMMLYRPDVKLIDPRFFLFALQSNQIQSRLDLISGGSTVGHVRVGDIRTLWMFQPKSMREQECIAAALYRASRRLTSELVLRDKLRQQKLGLMQDLLTGKVAVKVPESASPT